MALWQAHNFASAISTHADVETTEIVPIETDGDRILDRPLHEVEGKTLFIKEVEHALIAGKADVAVHCLKDYHPDTPPEFVVAAYLERDSDRDILITNTPISHLGDLPKGATVGTTSQRRIFFLKKARPDLNFGLLRGNIDTRLGKLKSNEFDAIVLAKAGINRLGISVENALVLEDEIMLPAVGQGALAIEVCANNPALADFLGQFNHNPTQICVEAERAFISTLSANCKSAVGVSCTILQKTKLRLKGHVGHPTTLQAVSGEIVGQIDQPRQLGRDLALQFLERGAAKLLDI